MKNRRPIVLGAVGDISYLAGVNAGVRKHGLDWPFELMAPYLEGVDILFGNLECVFVPAEYPQNKADPRALIAPFPGEEVAASLVRAGFTFLNLAQNHILDSGVVGMNYTREVLESAGLKTGGVGSSQTEARRLVSVERKGLTIGFLCYCEDNNYVLGTRGPCHAFYEREAVLADVEKAREAVDVLVVSVHADLEFMPAPSLPRLGTFREIAAAGADVVLGHHPHVPQGCEIYRGSLIAYSLGNFLFPAQTSRYMRSRLPQTRKSFLLKVQLGRNGFESFERLPVEIRGRSEERPVPLSGEEAKGALAYFAQLDAYLEDEAFLQEIWRVCAREKLGEYLRRAFDFPQESLMRRGVRRVLRRFGIDVLPPAQPNVGRVVDELVTRLCLTQENRLWMEEILRMGIEAHESRLSEEADQYHRPHFRFEHPKRGSKG